MEIFQTRLAAVLCSLLWVTLLGQGVGLGDPQRSLPTPTILGFCDTPFFVLAESPVKVKIRQVLTWTLRPSLASRTARSLLRKCPALACPLWCCLRGTPSLGPLRRWSNRSAGSRDRKTFPLRGCNRKQSERHPPCYETETGEEAAAPPQARVARLCSAGSGCPTPLLGESSLGKAAVFFKSVTFQQLHRPKGIPRPPSLLQRACVQRRNEFSCFTTATFFPALGEVDLKINTSPEGLLGYRSAAMPSSGEQKAQHHHGLLTSLCTQAINDAE